MKKLFLLACLLMVFSLSGCHFLPDKTTPEPVTMVPLTAIDFNTQAPLSITKIVFEDWISTSRNAFGERVVEVPSTESGPWRIVSIEVKEACTFNALDITKPLEPVALMICTP